MPNEEYPLLATAVAAGLFHPNCTHRTHLYIEGLSRPYGKTEDPEGYEREQKLRVAERGVQHWRNRKAVAMTSQDKLKATAKLKEWRGRRDDLLGVTPKPKKVTSGKELRKIIQGRYGSGGEGQSEEAKQHVAEYLSYALQDSKEFDKIVRAQFGDISEKEWATYSPAQKGLWRKRTCSRLVHQWAQTSGDANEVSIALQLSAMDEFNLTEANFSHLDANALRGARENLLPRYWKGYRAFLRAQYDATQGLLKRNKVEAVEVFRGWKTKKNIGGEISSMSPFGQFVKGEVELQPMSAFSSSMIEAKSFATKGTSGNIRIVSKVIVPRERILSCPRTGFGCLEEEEMVILGEPTRAESVVAELGANPYGIRDSLNNMVKEVGWK